MTGVLTPLLRILVVINDRVLAIGKSIAWVMLALMVVVILAQVFFRYVLNNALPWPDEAARFLMLWMTGLVAPLGYRHGAFVAIEMAVDALKGRAARLMIVVLLLISTSVLLVAIGYGWGHTMGFGGNFESSSLRLPFSWIGLEDVKVKLRYMYASLLVCVILLTSVNIELLLRNLIGLADPDAELPEPAEGLTIAAGAD